MNAFLMNLKRLSHSFLLWWDEFWFCPAPYHRLGLMRMVLGGTFFFLYLFRQFRIDFFDERSLIPRAEQLTVFPEYFKPFFSWNFWPDSWAPFIHLVYVFLLLLMFLGLSNRGLMIFSWVLHMGFIHRNYSHIFGADVIGGLFLLYIAFTDCQKSWSVRELFGRRSGATQSSQKDLLTPVFYRLMQIQICVIYAYTGFEKLKGVSWWDGTALWTVLANPQMTIPNMTWLRHFPLIIAGLTFVTIIFEVYFPAAILSRKVRPYWLLIGVGFHTGIGLFMGLIPFSLVMISTYALFFDIPLKITDLLQPRRYKN